MAGKLEAALRIAREGLEGLAREKSKTPREIGQQFGNQLPRVPFEEWRYEFEPTSQLLERKPFDAMALKEGDVFIPLVGDRTSNARKITSIGDQPLAFPTLTEGGPDYMRGPAQTEQGSVWASGQGVVTGLNDRLSRALRASEEAGYKDPNAYGVYVAMGPHGGDFSTHTAEAVMGMIPGSKITKKSAKEFDQGMKEIFPDWPGIMSPKAADYVVNANAGEHRKAFLDMIDSAYWRDKGFPDVSLARYATTTPELVDVPTEAAGYAVAKLDPTAPRIEAVVPHRSYPVPMQGEYAGSMPRGLMRDDLFNTFSRNYDLDPPARNYTMAKRRSFGMDPNAFQVLQGQDIEDLVRKVIGFKEEYAYGGEVDDDIDDAIRIAKDVGGSTDAPSEDMSRTYEMVSQLTPAEDPVRQKSISTQWFELPPEQKAEWIARYPDIEKDMEIERYREMAAAKAAQSYETRSMTHNPSVPRSDMKIDMPLLGGEYSLGSAPYNVAEGLQNMVQGAYDFKTMPLYFSGAAAPIALGIDVAESRLNDDPLGLALSAALTPQTAAALRTAGRSALGFARRNPKATAAIMGAGSYLSPDETEADPFANKALELTRDY